MKPKRAVVIKSLNKYAMDIEKFLALKPLYYDKIDLSRMPKAYESIKKHLNFKKAIHIVGTNGKGSTGRILAKLLQSTGALVGHYSSPHILRFNERIWIDGNDVSNETLQSAHRKLISWFTESMAKELSYFEYTTLLALVVFEGADFIVLEAGLGGEFDATNVVDKDLSVITPIGIDHQAFLGENIEDIAATKLRSIQKRALIAPQYFDKVYKIAETIAHEKKAKLYYTKSLLDSKAKENIDKICHNKKWPPFLIQNAKTSYAAAILAGVTPKIEVFENISLKGRFQRVLPNVIVDVGHNPLGAQAIAKALHGQKVILIYNALGDKDIKRVLKALKPVVKHIEIIPIKSDRAASVSDIKEIAKGLKIVVRDFKKVKKEDDYLVFGSFYTVEAFLKEIMNEY